MSGWGAAVLPWQQVEMTAICGSKSCGPGAFAPGLITDTATKAGWTIGGGVETMLDSHWTARAEYRYADFGSVTNTDTYVCPPGACAAARVTQLTTYNVALQTHTATFALSYKF
jgi:outer membrane immunogenic protein